MNSKFNQSFTISICALESENEKHAYAAASLPAGPEIKYIFNAEDPDEFIALAKTINEDPAIGIVMIQHEFGFFRKTEDDFRQFLAALTKPVVIAFHTVLPRADESLKAHVQQISAIAESIIVMTHSSAEVLINDYGVPPEKITVPAGTT